MIFRLNNTLQSQPLKTAPAGRSAGFTLVDILVGLGMASVIMVIVVGIFTTMAKSYTTQNVAADVQQVARAGVDLMIQEIRMAGFDPTGSAAAGIVNDFDQDSGFHTDHDGNIAPTDATHFAFTIDADMDGRIDHCRSVDLAVGCSQVDDNVENELIAYQINDGALEKYRGGSARWEDLTENNVSNLNFTYYDDAGAVTTSVNAIRTIEISMTVQLPAGRGGTVSRTYSTRVRCRNIGL
jgi:type II secretory pathway pseudopilin PulG